MTGNPWYRLDTFRAALRLVGMLPRDVAQEVAGALGPCIHAECYPFGADDLDAVAAVWGEGVRGRTGDDRPALDLPAAVAAALAGSGVAQVSGVDACTSCAGGYFSHRARGDLGRQALLVWSAAAGPG